MDWDRYGKHPLPDGTQVQMFDAVQQDSTSEPGSSNQQTSVGPVTVSNQIVLNLSNVSIICRCVWSASAGRLGDYFLLMRVFYC